MGDPKRLMTTCIIAVSIITQVLFGSHRRSPMGVNLLVGHVGGRRRKFRPPVSGSSGKRDLADPGLGAGALTGRDGQRTAHPFGCVRDGDRAVARARDG